MDEGAKPQKKSFEEIIAQENAELDELFQKMMGLFAQLEELPSIIPTLDFSEKVEVDPDNPNIIEGKFKDS